jgi:AbrB family looped-hinge helix DNA binding protein
MEDETITMSGKGQIVIPARVRKRFGLKKGAKLIIDVEDMDIKLTPKTVDLTTLVGSVKPVFDRETVRKKLREMRENW